MSEQSQQKQIKEQIRLDKRIDDIISNTKMLPMRMVQCEAQVADISTMSKQVMEKNDEIIQQNCEIKACKLEINEFRKAMDNIEKHFKDIEIFADNNKNKTMELQNWIDVYMPLRFQY